jgi:hypothetical protein
MSHQHNKPKAKNHGSSRSKTGANKHMFTSHEKNAGQNQVIKISSEAFENVAKFRFLGVNTKKSKLHA